jgi:hypothetical protein
MSPPPQRTCVIEPAGVGPAKKSSVGLYARKKIRAKARDPDITLCVDSHAVAVLLVEEYPLVGQREIIRDIERPGALERGIAVEPATSRRT